MHQQHPGINEERLYSDFVQAASFGATPAGAVNRPAFSEADVQVRRWLMERAQEAGLDTRIDPLNNVIVGDADDTPGVWTGSHLDTVPDGGKYDGALGAIVGFECVRRIYELGIPLQRPVRSIAFSDEEGSYLGFLGSRGLWNGLADLRADPDATPLDQITGWNDERLESALSRAGGDIHRAESAQLPTGIIEKFIELHVEQGPRLESEALDIGVVTGIVGVGRCTVDFHGRPDHAGTTPMGLREDALRAAARMIDALASVPETLGLTDAVVTCGQVQVDPGATNVVPGKARLVLDYRDATLAGLQRLREGIEATALQAVQGTEITAHVADVSLTPPVDMDPEIIAQLTQTTQQLGYTHRHMQSGAGHDTQIMANIAPVGMVFVPSHQGRSHSHLEHTDWQDVVNGANVLFNTLLHYATHAEP